MVNKKPLPIPDLASNLFDDFEDSYVPKITGQWFSIKIIPDLVAGDSFNVGIAFISNSDLKLHYKIIPSAKPFQCLYGINGLDNFNFLLKTTEEMLKNGVNSSSSSPHIIYSNPSYASGITIDEILNSLYNTMVRLQCHENTTIEDEKYSLSSDRLRGKLFSKLKKELPSVYERIYRQDPIKLKDPATDSEIKISLPIWNNHPDMLHNHSLLLGNVVSAYYISEVHRGYSLEKNGCTQIRNACEIMGKKTKAGIFIYRPTNGDPGFNSDLLTQVDSDIDQVLHSLQLMKKNGYHIDIEVESNQETLYQRILNFI